MSDRTITFEQWVKDNYGFNPSEKDVNFQMHRESWKYLQAEIEKLEEDVRFYKQAHADVIFHRDNKEIL